MRQTKKQKKQNSISGIVTTGLGHDEARALVERVTGLIRNDPQLDGFTVTHNANTGLGIACLEPFSLFENLTRLDETLRTIGLCVFGVYPSGGEGTLYLAVCGVDEE